MGSTGSMCQLFSLFSKTKAERKKNNFLKELYAVQKEVVWEMEREPLETGAFAPLKFQSHDLSIFTQAGLLELLY